MFWSATVCKKLICKKSFNFSNKPAKLPERWHRHQQSPRQGGANVPAVEQAGRGEGRCARHRWYEHQPQSHPRLRLQCQKSGRPNICHW